MESICPLSKSPTLLQLVARKRDAWHDPQALLLSGLADGHTDAGTLLWAAALVLTGGALHGIAMALRKFFGQGHCDYWKQWRWWSGVLCDAIGGLCIWPAMPVLAAQVLMPMATVCQLVVAYSLALAFFREHVAVVNHLGLVLAVAGVVGISASSPIHAAPEASAERWEQPRFLCVFLLCAGLAVGSFALKASFRWALATAFCEAVQFLTSRTIAGAFENWGTEEQSAVSLLCAAALKATCIICIMHFQQMGMEEELSRFVGTFMVATNLLTVVMSLSFFGDQVRLSALFLGSAALTLLGIWLLNFPASSATKTGGAAKEQTSNSTDN